MIISSNDPETRPNVWSAFKKLLLTKKGSLQANLSDDSQYLLWFYDGIELNTCTIWRREVPHGVVASGYSQDQNDSDKADFEANFELLVNTGIEKRDAQGRLIHVPEPRVGEEFIIVTHNFSDMCTWYGDSIRVTNQVLTGSDDNLTFSSGVSHWIDMVSGRVLNDDDLVSKQMANNPSAPHGYQVNVSVDGAVQTMREPFMTSGGDYEVIWETGDVVFFSPVSGVVSSSFSYAAGSTWYLTPDTGKIIKIEAAEADYSSNIVMNDTIEYSYWGYAQIFAPEYVGPGGLAPTDRVKLKARRYKRYAQILQEAIGSYPTLINNASSREHQALSLDEFRRKSRGVQSDSIAIPFRYATINELQSSMGIQLQCKLLHDQPFDGEQVTTTFYCTIDNE